MGLLNNDLRKYSNKLSMVETQEEVANGNQINGIRFASQMNKKYYDALKANKIKLQTA